MIDPKPLTTLDRTFRSLCLMCLISVLSACASMSPRTPEDAVRERAQSRWNALLAGKWDEAYQYLSPGSRAMMSFDRYRGSFGSVVSWKSAQVHAVSCPQPDRCTASIKVTYVPTLRRGTLSTIETSVEEIWLLDAGQWWLPQGL
jgi:hypothetical protein